MSTKPAYELQALKCDPITLANKETKKTKKNKKHDKGTNAEAQSSFLFLKIFVIIFEGECKCRHDTLV